MLHASRSYGFSSNFFSAFFTFSGMYSVACRGNRSQMKSTEGQVCSDIINRSDHFRDFRALLANSMGHDAITPHQFIQEALQLAMDDTTDKTAARDSQP